MSRLSREVGELRMKLMEHYPLGSIPPFNENNAEDPAVQVLSTPIYLRRNTQLPSLFDYQEDLVTEALERYIPRGAPALVSLPTGAGKTRTGICACLGAFHLHEAWRIIWLAPTRELVHQAVSAATALWQQYGAAPDIVVTRELLEIPEPTLVVTTPQAIYRAVQAGRDLGLWDLVVFDEAHQAVASTFRASVEALRERPRRNGGKVGLLGLSATPGRFNDSESYFLSEFFENRLLVSPRLGSNPVLTLQRRGVLARLRFKKLTHRTVSKSDEVTRIRIAAEAARSLSRRGGKPLVFTSSVAAAICLAEVLATMEVSARAVYSDLPSNARDQAIADFSVGKVDVLVNYRLLATGYDCPAVSDILLLNEIGSAIQFEQIVGRVARGPLTGGSKVGTVWEFDDHLSKHGLPTSYYRYRDFEWT
ncbi:DEAD/DEAH box helicase [Gordonia terrae]